MSKDAPKKNKKLISAKRLKVIKLLSENVGMSVSKAMREAGYAASSARQPQRITQSETFKDVLNRIGFTDEKLAKGYHELSSASTLREYTFESERKEELIEIDEDDPTYIKGGREKQYHSEYTWIPVTAAFIKKVIEKIPGAQYIGKTDHYNKTVVYYTVPEHAPRAKALELASKAKGSFSPEQVNVQVQDEEITPEERKQLDAIRNLNP